MLKKILVPVDGSEPGWCALEYARELGEKFAGSLTLIHVIPQAYTISLAGPVPYVPDNIGTLEDSGQNLMKLAMEKLSGYPYPISTCLEFGNPSSRILAIAKEQDQDAIVIGSRGLSSVAEFFLGSVSTNVVQHAKIPVIIVKSKDCPDQQHRNIQP
ncbi:MAG TPA: universal stress protein [Patescibacteria group bacterium]|nr:universal stress protein [Patescibacteria group bacterium]